MTKLLWMLVVVVLLMGSGIGLYWMKSFRSVKVSSEIEGISVSLNKQNFDDFLDTIDFWDDEVGIPDTKGAQPGLIWKKPTALNIVLVPSLQKYDPNTKRSGEPTSNVGYEINDWGVVKVSLWVSSELLESPDATLIVSQRISSALIYMKYWGKITEEDRVDLYVMPIARKIFNEKHELVSVKR